MDTSLSNYTGSQRTAERVRAEVLRRWGPEAAKEYSPTENCFTYSVWRRLNYQVKKGEKSIRSITFVEKKDENGKVVRSYPKIVHLFYVNQVQPIS